MRKSRGVVLATVAACFLGGSGPAWASDVALQTIDLNGSDLRVTGRPGETNHVTVGRDSRTFTVHDSAGITPGAGCALPNPADKTTVRCTAPLANPSGAADYVVHLGDGNDTFRPTGIGLGDAFGDGGNDRLDGNNDEDRLHGGDGNDVINGSGGGDALDGDNGNDIVAGGDGDDGINGGSGTDTLRGDRGGDRITAGPGRTSDSLSGGAGFDNLTGSAGPNRIDGGPGWDKLSGVDGNDLMLSRDGGSDAVFCGRGRDRLKVDSVDFISDACELRRSPSVGATTLLDTAFMIVNGTYFSDPEGAVSIGCSGDGPKRCRGTITVHAGRTVYLRGPYRVARGQIGHPGELKPTNAARRLPLRKKIGVRIAIATTDRNGRRIVKSRRGTFVNFDSSDFE